jgi:hypothetical protein
MAPKMRSRSAVEQRPRRRERMTERKPVWVWVCVSV